METNKEYSIFTILTEFGSFPERDKSSSNNFLRSLKDLGRKVIKSLLEPGLVELFFIDLIKLLHLGKCIS